MEVDRISYSFGMKLNLGNYETCDYHLSLSTDVRQGETQEEAMSRAIEFVETAAEKEFDKFRVLKKK